MRSRPFEMYKIRVIGRYKRTLVLSFLLTFGSIATLVNF
jgi:hypothetical protein